MWLAEALAHQVGRRPEPLTSIGAVYREFLRGAPGVGKTEKAQEASRRAYAIKRMSEASGPKRPAGAKTSDKSYGVGVREVQRYLTRAQQVRGETNLRPGNPVFDRMAAAAEGKRFGYFRQHGMNVYRLDAEITISGDWRRRQINDIDIEPGELLDAFLDKWGDGSDIEEALSAFEVAYFDAFTVGDGHIAQEDLIRRETDVDFLEVLGGIAREA